MATLIWRLPPRSSRWRSVAHPSVEIDERLDLVVAGRGGRDDVAAVGVPDEYDRAGQRPQELGEVGRVAGEVAKRVAESDGAECFALESADLGVEARRIGPCTVDKDDRRFVLVGPCGLSLLPRRGVLET